MPETEIRILINDVNVMKRELALINVKLDERCTRHDNSISDTQERIHKVEMAQAKWAGIAVAFSFLISYVLKGLGL